MHTFYHIPGLKIGCTKDLSRRIELATMDGRAEEYSKLEVLMEVEGLTDQEAGDMEWKLADQYGYIRGPHYATIVNNQSERGKIGGVKSAITNSQNGTNAFFDPDLREASRLKATEAARGKGAEANREAKTNVFSEDKHVQRSGGLSATSVVRVCPHCGHEGKAPSIYRSHFDRCQSKIS